MNEPLTYTVHVLHDLSGAVWFGGNLFGVAALNSGVRAAHNHRERGAVLNQTWANFAPMSVASAATFAATWATIRLTDPRLSMKENRPIARARDWLTVALLLNTAASGILNRTIANAEPDGRVPVAGGTEPDAETPEAAAKAQRKMRFFAATNIMIGGALITTGAILEQREMNAGLQPRGLMAFGKRLLAVDALRTLAAVELVRQGGKIVAESIGALRSRIQPPPPQTRLQRFASTARHTFSDGRDRVVDSARHIMRDGRERIASLTR